MGEGVTMLLVRARGIKAIGTSASSRHMTIRREMENHEMRECVDVLLVHYLVRQREHNMAFIKRGRQFNHRHLTIRTVPYQRRNFVPNLTRLNAHRRFRFVGVVRAITVFSRHLPDGL